MDNYASTPLIVTLIGQMVLFCTGLAAVLVPLIKDARQRRWLLEDKAESERRTADLAAKVERDRQILSEAMTRVREELVAQIRHSTAGVSQTVMTSRELLQSELHNSAQVAKSAFSEANDVNSKLRMLTEAITNNQASMLAQQSRNQTNELLRHPAPVTIHQPEGDPVPVELKKNER